MNRFLFALTLVFCCNLSHAQEITRRERKMRTRQEAAERKDEKTDRIFNERFEEANRVYHYPVDSNHKITYRKEFTVPHSKAVIYKKLEKFIVLEKFDRSEQIRCKDDKAIVNARPFDNPVVYKDDESGELIFNGFFPIPFLQFRNCLLTFQGTVKFRNGTYAYTLTDFKVLEFKSAPKSKSRGGSTNWGYGISTGQSTSTFSETDVRTIALEKFMQNPDYAVSSDKAFNEQRKAMIQRLKQILGE